jgi:NADH-quinone oxidoreductase subunit L
MFVGVGVGAYWAGVYHLVTHAFFKACLFLGSGSVILGCHHEQDMRKMGGLKKYMPLTERTYWYACVAISGFPIASGFFSKDEILWNAFNSHLLVPGWLIWLIGWLAATGTSSYMWRSYYMTFTGEYRGGHDEHHDAHADDHADAHAAHADPHAARSLGAAAAGDPALLGDAHADAHDAPAAKDDHAAGGHGHAHGVPHESPRSMTWVLAILAFGAAGMIGIGFWAPIGVTPALEHWLEPVTGLSQQLAFPGEHAPKWAEWLLMGLSVAVAFAGWFAARVLYKDAKSPLPARLAANTGALHKAWDVVYHKYYVDELYAATFVKGTLGLRSLLFWMDRNIIDGAVNLVGTLGKGVGFLDGAFDKYVVDGLVNLVGTASQAFGRFFRRLQTGRIQTYLAGALAGAFAFVVLSYLIRGR